MSDLPPNVREPTVDELNDMAEKHYFQLSEGEIDAFSSIIEDTLGEYERLDELSEPVQDSAYTTRETGNKPGNAEDPYNCIVTRCTVEGNEEGPLADYDVGIKDNIAVAGVEMTFGSKVMEGYVPARDATLVTWLLDAGANISAKTNMEDMAFGGAGDLSAFGPVLNPRDTGHLAGGSSGGSAAAVVAGDVDIAIGGDQGGSIRMPAAFTGCVGLKPTHSLVPYTGIGGLGYSIDHVGPITRTVEDCAKTLSVIAGYDPLDPRQCPGIEKGRYTNSLEDNMQDLTIGVVEEGFGIEPESGVDDVVRRGLELFEDQGAAVEDVSIPAHDDGVAIWNGVAIEETAAFIRSEGVGYFGQGLHDTQFANYFSQARRVQADDYPPTLKLTLLLGEYLAEKYRGHYYYKSQNLRRMLTRAYDDILSNVDVLAMPTVPHTARELRDDLSLEELIRRSLGSLPNCAPFNVTGHPAISVPCGRKGGLPVGLMFIGDMFDDETVLRASYAFEQNFNWEEL